jgi:predicted Ser/Thr protein kinase
MKLGELPGDEAEEVYALAGLLDGLFTPHELRRAWHKADEARQSGGTTGLVESLIAIGVVAAERAYKPLDYPVRDVVQCGSCGAEPAVVLGDLPSSHKCWCGRLLFVPPVKAGFPCIALKRLPEGVGVERLMRLVTEQEHAAYGGYEILDLLGKGGVGVVYRARHALLDKQVALKVISGEASKDPLVVQRFLTEARAAGKMQHENIVGALDCQQKGETYYLVLEYVRGVTVDQVERWRKPLGEQESLEIVLDAAKGLDFAWSRGIVHRDVKPQNVILDSRGRGRVLDLGLSKDITQNTAFTLPGRISCTPMYASPEQITRQPLDFRTDVYALGVMLYEMLTGELPFADKSITRLLMMHVKDPAPRARWKRQEISEAADSLAARMLEKDREKRFASQEDALQAIRAALPQGATERIERAASSVSPVPTPAASVAGGESKGGDTAPARGGCAKLILLMVAVASALGLLLAGL